MSPFFAIIFTCGYFSCDPPKPMDFNSAEACQKFAENFVDSVKNGIAAACFNRETGQLTYSSRDEYDKRKNK